MLWDVSGIVHYCDSLCVEHFTLPGKGYTAGDSGPGNKGGSPRQHTIENESGLTFLVREKAGIRIGFISHLRRR
jgi:hypothetical protein